MIKISMENQRNGVKLNLESHFPLERPITYFAQITIRINWWLNAMYKRE